MGPHAPCWGVSASEFGAGCCSQGRIGRARAPPSSAPDWERPSSSVGPCARGKHLVLLWAVAVGLVSPHPWDGPEGRWFQRRCPEASAAPTPPWAEPSHPDCYPVPASLFARSRAEDLVPVALVLLTARRSGKADALSIVQPVLRRAWRAAKRLKSWKL